MGGPTTPFKVDEFAAGPIGRTKPEEDFSNTVNAARLLHDFLILTMENLLNYFCCLLLK
jgi:hypothetical protein